MKKIALLLCVIMCLGVFISCKKEPIIEPTDDPPIEIDVSLTYYLSKNVFIANVLEYTERIDEKASTKYNTVKLLDLTLEVVKVFKGQYTPEQTVEITLEKHNVDDFLYPIKEGEADLQYFFALDNEYTDKEMSYTEKFYIENTVRTFKISKDGLIRINYKRYSEKVRRIEELKCMIPLSVEDVVHQMYFNVYRPIVRYLKTNLNTNLVGLIDKAENIFIGEIQPKIPSYKDFTAYLEKNGIGDRVEGIEYKYANSIYWLFKVKVKVTKVYKGDYKVGDIVDSYVLVDRDYGYESTHYSDEQLFIDGAGFYESSPAA